MGHITDQFKKRISKGQYFELAKDILSIGIGFFYERVDIYLMSRPLDLAYRQAPVPKSLRDANYEYRTLSVDEVDNIDFIGDVSKGHIKAHLNTGAEIFAGLYDGKVLTYHLSRTEWMIDYLRDLKLPLEKHQVYQFDGMVSVKYRSKGIGQTHMQLYNEAMLARGFTETSCFVEKNNPASLRFHSRNNFTIKATGIYRRILFKKIWNWEFHDTPPEVI